MKTIASVTLLLTLVLVSTSFGFAQDDKQAAAKAKSKYLKTKFDKGKDITTVSLKTISLSGSMTQEVGNLADVPQLDLDGSFTYQGSQMVKPVEATTLAFKTFSRYPVYQRGQNLVGVLDNDRALMLGATEYKSSSRTFGIEEILSISVPLDAMQKIADAKTVKFVLGAREIKLKEKDHEALRELARAMTPAS
jgi:hypothetical protein